MSKGLGQKIAIKFTERLVGDLSGNERAFRVIGNESRYINGPIDLKDYEILSVGRYPTPRMWELGQVLELDGDVIIESFESATVNDRVTLTGTWQRGERASSHGRYSLESNNKNNSSDTSAYLAFNANGVMPFSIDYRVSSETNYDKFYLYHNGTVVVSAISGNGNWLTYNGITTTGQNIIRARYTKDGSASSNLDAGFIDNLLMAGDYETPKIYTSQRIPLTGEYQIKWLAETPAGTSVTIEYTTGESQGTWTEVSNGGTLVVNANLWLRATLETEDTTVTPKLKDLWLEEPGMPEDMILLTMHPQGRFNNAIGNLTVSYDHTIGNLQGRGGFVESFTVMFSPTNLIPFPQPNVEQGIIAANASTTMSFIHIDYKRRYAEESVTVSPACSAVFIHVDDINP